MLKDIRPAVMLQGLKDDCKVIMDEVDMDKWCSMTKDGQMEYVFQTLCDAMRKYHIDLPCYGTVLIKKNGTECILRDWWHNKKEMGIRITTYKFYGDNRFTYRDDTIVLCKNNKKIN